MHFITVIEKIVLGIIKERGVLEVLGLFSLDEFLINEAEFLANKDLSAINKL